MFYFQPVPRPKPMAVRADDIALGDLLQENRNNLRTLDRVSNVEPLLPPNVIEVHRGEVKTAVAVDARYGFSSASDALELGLRLLLSFQLFSSVVRSISVVVTLDRNARTDSASVVEAVLTRFSLRKGS